MLGLASVRDTRYGVPLTDAGIAKLKELAELEDLQLGRASVGDEAMKTISTFKKLKTLDPQHTRVTDVGVAEIKGLQLHWVCLNGTKVTGRGIAALAGMKELEWLIVENTSVDDAAIQTIARLKTLQSLYISGTQVTEAGFQNLTSLDRLASSITNSR